MTLKAPRKFPIIMTTIMMIMVIIIMVMIIVMMTTTMTACCPPLRLQLWQHSWMDRQCFDLPNASLLPILACAPSTEAPARNLVTCYVTFNYIAGALSVLGWKCQVKANISPVAIYGYPVSTHTVCLNFRTVHSVPRVCLNFRTFMKGFSRELLICPVLLESVLFCVI